MVDPRRLQSPNSTAGVLLGADSTLPQPQRRINKEKARFRTRKKLLAITQNHEARYAMETVLDAPTHDSTISIPLSPNSAPLYAKCLSCPDFVTACRGVDITLLSGSAEKRNYHKAIKKEYGFLTKDIYALVKDTIGKSTTEEYFGPGTGDYKWLTVTTIHNALLLLVADKKGLPLCEHSCSASSSEVRNQLAAADLNLAAANMTIANMQAECDDLRRRLSDADGNYVAQLAEIQSSKTSEIDWFKSGIAFWRRFAIALILLLFVVLAMLGFCAAWILAHI